MSTTNDDYKRLRAAISKGIVDGVMEIFCFMILGYFLMWLVLGVTGAFMDDTDASGWRRSGMDILTDAKTGLQYLAHGHSLTPRLGNDRKQLSGTP